MTESSYRLVPWTLAALIVSAFPHVFRVPIQISVIVACLLLSRLFLHRRAMKMPHQWLKVLLVFTCFAIVLATFRTINGVDAGSSLLLCMVGIKTLEMNTLRDHSALIIASFFIIVSFVLYDTNIWSGFYLIATAALSLFVLLKISAPSTESRKLLPNTKTFIWYALPLAIILFILFPRLPGPFWGLPKISNKAKTGLSDSMTPGSITELIRSDELAFRALFIDKEPARRQMYWRGPVLHDFDGTSWKRTRIAPERSSEDNSDFQDQNDQHYEVILEPHNKRWLFVLDYPRVLPEQSWVLNDFQVGRTEPVSQLIKYQASAHLSESNPGKIQNYILRKTLELPENSAPRSRELAQTWRDAYTNEWEIVNAALSMFNKNLFSYTLSPQQLDMSNSVDDFLFRTQEGFCEHYASAFVVLMRAAGIPARVVTGYLGGEKNELNGYYRVKQSDAHAWAEVYLQDRGWTRVDPTAAIAPERIEQSLEDTFPEDNLGGYFGSNILFLRIENSWYALNTLWFEWVLDFNADTQINLMEKLGFKNPDWRSLIWLLVSGVIGLTLFMSIHIWRQSRLIIKDPLQKIYIKFIARLSKLGVTPVRGEGPQDLSQRAELQLPEKQQAISDFIHTYINARYYAAEKQPGQSGKLKKLLLKI